MIKITYSIRDIEKKSKKFHKKEETPLNIALQNEFSEISTILLAHGADIKIPNLNNQMIWLSFILWYFLINKGH